MSDPDMHEYLYGDPKRVHAARVQAEGRLAMQRIAKAVTDALTPFLDRASEFLRTRL